MAAKKKKRKAIDQRKRERIAEFGEEQPNSENESHVGLDGVVKKGLLGIVTITTLGILILVAVTLHQKRLRETHKQQWEAEIKHGGKGSRPGENATWEAYEPVGWYEITEHGAWADEFIHTYRLTGNDRIRYMRVNTRGELLLDRIGMSEKEAKQVLRRKGIKVSATQ